MSASSHGTADAVQSVPGGEFRLGELLVGEGLVTQSQLNEALHWQREHGGYTPLGQVLVKRKMLTRRQLDVVLNSHSKRPRLGDALIRSGLLTSERLDYALAQQKKTNERLGQVLIKLKYITDENLREALAVQLDIPYIDLDSLTLDKDLCKVVNRSYARRHNLVPVTALGETLTVCLDDPTERTVIEDLSRSTGRLVTVVTASHEAIMRALARLYGTDRAATPAQAPASAPVETLILVTEVPTDTGKSKYTDEYQKTKTADVIVRTLLTLAIQHRASDIHIEMLANRLQIRYRIDGLLEQLDMGDLQEACNQSAREVVSRLKILGKLDIAEKRRPQDGSFRVKVERQGEQGDVDLRISIVPGYYGESTVVRVLDRSNAPTSLEQLQLPAPVEEKLRQLLERSAGIILVTGPTGSGKSTTLYASLMTVYRPHIRVLTAEDPIEYIYDQFSQSEVNAEIGNTFANYLRAFLRHDPEVIMVGEIRDDETAEMAFRAAQTGHLLLSTLHTNTAIETIPRLLDLKIDPNTLASSLIGVMGQRLVRKVCSKCTAAYRPSDDLMREFFGGPPNLTLHKGRGCDECHFTGYRGRVGIVELWVPGEEDIVLISKRAPLDQLVASARNSTSSLAESAWTRLSLGETTVEELIRVLPYQATIDFRQRYTEKSLRMDS